MPEVQKGKKTKIFTCGQTPTVSSFAPCVNRKAVQRWLHGQVAGGSCYSLKKDEGLVLKRNACECVSCARWFLGGWGLDVCRQHVGLSPGPAVAGCSRFPPGPRASVCRLPPPTGTWKEEQGRASEGCCRNTPCPAIPLLRFASSFLLLAIFSSIALNLFTPDYARNWRCDPLNVNKKWLLNYFKCCQNI